MKTIYSICILSILICNACNNNDSSLTEIYPQVPISTDTTSNSIEKPEEELITGNTPLDKSFTFIYKGNTYHTAPTIEDTLIFSDEKTRVLYEQLQQNSNLCTYVHADGVLEFFDSFEEFKPIKNDNDPIYEEPGETPLINYQLTLHVNNIKDESNDFTIEKNIQNNNTIYQDKYDFALIENGQYLKNTVSFEFSMINKNTTSELTPKWPVQYKLWLVFFDNDSFTGKTLVYNPNIHYPIEKKLQISEPNLANINWDNRISCVLIMMTPF